LSQFSDCPAATDIGMDIGKRSGWIQALRLTSGRMGLDRILADAIGYSREGFAISSSQALYTATKLDELKDIPGFADIFLSNGQAPTERQRLSYSALARTLAALAKNGLDAFYQGEIAALHGDFLEAIDSPLRGSDFPGTEAHIVDPSASTCGMPGCSTCLRLASV
jgi:gamma-glutamyltranspeptidase